MKGIPAWGERYRELRNRKDMGLPLRPAEEQELVVLESKLMDWVEEEEKQVGSSAQKLKETTGGIPLVDAIEPEISQKFVKSIQDQQPLYEEFDDPSSVERLNRFESARASGKSIDDAVTEAASTPTPKPPIGFAPETPPRGEPIPLALNENFPPGSTYPLRREPGSGGPSGSGGTAREGSGPWALEATTQPRLIEIRDAIKALSGGSRRVSGPDAPGKRGPQPSDVAPEEEQPDRVDEGLSKGISFTNPYVGGFHAPTTNRFLRRTRAVYRGIGKIRQWMQGKKASGTPSPIKSTGTPISPRSGLPVATPVNTGATGGRAAAMAAGGGGAAGGGAAAGAAGSAGGGAGAAGAAAAGGPITLAAAAVVALGYAALEAGKQVYAFARAQEAEIRRLSEFGASQAVGIAQLDVGRTFRDIKTAQETGESSLSLTQSLDKFETVLQPIESLLTNIGNTIAGKGLDVLTDILTAIQPIFDLIKAIYDILPGKKEDFEKKFQTPWDVIQRMEDDQRNLNKPMWPQSPIGNSPFMG